MSTQKGRPLLRGPDDMKDDPGVVKISSSWSVLLSSWSWSFTNKLLDDPKCRSLNRLELLQNLTDERKKMC